MFSTASSHSVPTDPSFTVLNTLLIQPTNGNRLRYKAWISFQVDDPSAVDVEIEDVASGLIIPAQKGFETVTSVLADSIYIEWEAGPVTGAARTVILRAKVTAGTLSVIQSYLSVDEYATP